MSHVVPLPALSNCLSHVHTHAHALPHLSDLCSLTCSHLHSWNMRVIGCGCVCECVWLMQSKVTLGDWYDNVSVLWVRAEVLMSAFVLLTPPTMMQQEAVPLPVSPNLLEPEDKKLWWKKFWLLTWICFCTLAGVFLCLQTEANVSFLTSLISVTETWQNTSCCQVLILLLHKDTYWINWSCPLFMDCAFFCVISPLSENCSEFPCCLSL